MAKYKDDKYVLGADPGFGVKVVAVVQSLTRARSASRVKLGPGVLPRKFLY